METFQNNNIENSQMREVFEKLKAYAKQGYLFHGSKEKVNVLEPRRAKDDDPNDKVGNLHAVYATADIRIPIVMALFDEKDHSKNGWRSFYETKDEKMTVGGENITFTPGYIHVLPKESFQKTEDVDKDMEETVSYVPVTPVDIIQITPEVLNLIPGITYDLK
jgi:hypothetical protein